MEYCEDPYEAVRDADAVLILTGWPEYRDLDWQRIKELMAAPNLVDGRNLLEGREPVDIGFVYKRRG